MQLFAGELAAAASLLDEAEAVTEATGSHAGPYAAPVAGRLAGPRSRGAAR